LCLALHVPELVSNISPEASSGPLISRDGELQQLTRLLGDGVYSNAGARRLITLCGCHGVGKSAVAMAVARRLMPKDVGREGKPFPVSDGAFTPMIVDCRGCDGTFGSLTSRILAVFGLRHRQPYDTGPCDVITQLLSPGISPFVYYKYIEEISSVATKFLKKITFYDR